MALMVFRHLGLKVLSIALAALLWLLVSGEQVVERALRVPLEFTNLPPQLELVGDTPDLVEVRIRGSSGALSRIPAGELAGLLDLRTARPGQRLFHLTTSDVRAPFGIEVIQIAPSNISVRFEPSATKSVPVVPDIDGEPRDGYAVGTITADPATVDVAGPASAVARLTEAITEPISVAGASESITESVTVGVRDPDVRLQSPASARVTVAIGPASAEWSVPGIRVRASDGADPAQIAPSTVTVHVRGAQAARESGAEEFEASVETAGLAAGFFDLPVRVTTPSRIGVVRVDPPTVRVRVR
jgi:YbbR domain-containing protein